MTLLDPVWRPQPFRNVISGGRSDTSTWQHPLHERALGLDETTFQALLRHDNGSGGSSLMYEWMQDALDDLADANDTARAQAQAFGSMMDVIKQLPAWRAGDIQNQAPLYSGRTQPREASGVPGRKWEQVEAFTRLVPDGSNPIVDWCSGKGHLARWMHTSSSTCGRNYRGVGGRQVHCLEINPNLCRSGEELTQKQRSIQPNGVLFYEHDVLSDSLPSNLQGADYTYTALHACGELHRTALVSAAAQQAKTVVVVPCCYEKHFSSNASNLDEASRDRAFQPLSVVAKERSSLLITRDDLFLAVADGVVTASVKEAKMREKEMAWRLAFKLWWKDVDITDSAAFLEYTVPSAPNRLLVEDDFALFLRHCITSKGRSSAARKRLEPALDAALSNRRNLEEYAARGEVLRMEVERLELVRRVFQRPFELWLTADYGLFLEENGYEVDMLQLCDRSITPRNIAIVAQRS